MSDWMDDLRELEKLREESLLTPEEYERQRNMIIENRYSVSESVGKADVGVSGWARFGAWLLDWFVVCVGFALLPLLGLALLVGWIIWACTLSGTGQTPAKKLLNQTVIDLETGKPMTLGRMFGMRGLLGGLVALMTIPLTIYVLAFMPFWDKRNQNIWDKVSNSLVVRTPNSIL